MNFDFSENIEMHFSEIAHPNSKESRVLLINKVMEVYNQVLEE